MSLESLAYEEISEKISPEFQLLVTATRLIPSLCFHYNASFFCFWEFFFYVFNFFRVVFFYKCCNFFLLFLSLVIIKSTVVTCLRVQVE